MMCNVHMIYIYTWNPNDPSFGSKRPCFEGLTFKNRGHLGSRYIHIIYIASYHETSPSMENRPIRMELVLTNGWWPMFFFLSILPGSLT